MEAVLVSSIHCFMSLYIYISACLHFPMHKFCFVQYSAQYRQIMETKSLLCFLKMWLHRVSGTSDIALEVMCCEQRVPGVVGRICKTMEECPQAARPKITTAFCVLPQPRLLRTSASSCFAYGANEASQASQSSSLNCICHGP